MKVIFIPKRKVLGIFRNPKNGFDINIHNQTYSSIFKSAPPLTRMLEQWKFKKLSQTIFFLPICNAQNYWYSSSLAMLTLQKLSPAGPPTSRWGLC